MLGLCDDVHLPCSFTSLSEDILLLTSRQARPVRIRPCVVSGDGYSVIEKHRLPPILEDWLPDGELDVVLILSGFDVQP